MARSLRVQFEGALYHVSIRGNNRQVIFRGDQDRIYYLDLLDRYREQFGCRVYAYILLNNHIQICVETPKGNVSKFMQCLGTSYAAYFNRKHRRRGTLFEGRFKSCLLVKEKYLLTYTRHIHRYSLQKGLKMAGKDYLWSSYPFYLGKRECDFLEINEVLGHFGDVLSEQRSRYQEFVESGSLKLNRSKDDFLFNPTPYLGKAGWSETGNDELNKRVPYASDHRRALEIIQGVSVSLGMNGLEDLKDKRRNKSFARHVAMYLIRRQTPLPLRSIGALLGVKAPAVAVAIGKVERLRKNGLFPFKLVGELVARHGMLKDY